jgi:hypothetical protein
LNSTLNNEDIEAFTGEYPLDFVKLCQWEYSDRGLKEEGEGALSNNMS